MGNLSSRGFTLIEALITLCLLSLAAIAILDLQWRSLRASRQSSLHSIAMQLATDMADGLRVAWPAPDAPATPGFDAWLAEVGVALPAGRAIICRDAAPWDEVAGAYRWDCGEPAGPLVIKIGWDGAGDGTMSPPRVVVSVAPVQP